MRPGRFITFEGGEGCGKSTQIALLAETLRAQSIELVQTREPGGSPGGEVIRNLLVSGQADSWDPITETLLFYAARHDHVSKVITPALDAGKMVLCDRFSDSTAVYQGVGKGISREFIAMLHRMTLANLAPDLTIILDIDPEIGLARAATRRGNETRFESMTIEFHRQIRAGFLALAVREPQRCVVLDASLPIAQLQQQILDLVRQRCLVRRASV